MWAYLHQNLSSYPGDWYAFYKNDMNEDEIKNAVKNFIKEYSPRCEDHIPILRNGFFAGVKYALMHLWKEVGDGIPNELLLVRKEYNCPFLGNKSFITLLRYDNRRKCWYQKNGDRDLIVGRITHYIRIYDLLDLLDNELK